MNWCYCVYTHVCVCIYNCLLPLPVLLVDLYHSPEPILIGLFSGQCLPKMELCVQSKTEGLHQNVSHDISVIAKLKAIINFHNLPSSSPRDEFLK